MTRRNFFSWGAGIVTVLSTIPLFLKKDKRKKKMTRMLTRDGKLVEVDINQLPEKVRLASNKEVQTWVWPDPNLRSKPLK